MDKLGQIEESLADKVFPLLLSVPNFVLSDDNLQIDEVTKTFLEPKTYEFKIQSHVKLSYINFGHHTSIVGPRSKFSTGNGAIIQRKLCNYFLNNLKVCDFIEFSGMDIVRTGVIEACRGTTEAGWLGDPMRVSGLDGESENQKHHLVGEASLESIMAFLSRKFIDPDVLPVKLVSSGARFTESIDQLNCISCAVLSRTKSDEEYKKILETTWKMYQELQIPIRLLSIGTKNLKNNETIRTEVQVWFPASKTWKSCGYVSDHSDYTPARIGKDFYLSEALIVDTDLLLNSIMENNQLEDGTFSIPEILEIENNNIFEDEIIDKKLKK